MAALPTFVAKDPPTKYDTCGVGCAAIRLEQAKEDTNEKSTTILRRVNLVMRATAGRLLLHFFKFLATRLISREQAPWVMSYGGKRAISIPALVTHYPLLVTSSPSLCRWID